MGCKICPQSLNKFKYDGRLEDEAVTLPVDDLLRHYMEPAVAAISSKIEGDLLQLYARFVDDVKVHAGSDAFACSMRANWLEAERQLKLLRAKNEVLLSYDKFVDDFWFLGDADLKMPEDAYLGLCLAGEAGEVAEKLKKAYRDSGGKVDVDGMVKELGDVLYYLVRYAHLLGSDLESVARKNVEKLQDRAARNALRGEGDDR
jgi:NTP pyrophosphatase (non-canonical NTP hydrolase)